MLESAKLRFGLRFAYLCFCFVFRLSFGSMDLCVSAHSFFPVQALSAVSHWPCCVLCKWPNGMCVFVTLSCVSIWLLCRSLCVMLSWFLQEVEGMFVRVCVVLCAAVVWAEAIYACVAVCLFWCVVTCVLFAVVPLNVLSCRECLFVCFDSHRWCGQRARHAASVARSGPWYAFLCRFRCHFSCLHIS